MDDEEISDDKNDGPELKEIERCISGDYKNSYVSLLSESASAQNSNQIAAA